jgi:hypothetical protein
LQIFIINFKAIFIYKIEHIYDLLYAIEEGLAGESKMPLSVLPTNLNSFLTDLPKNSAHHKIYPH